MKEDEERGISTWRQCNRDGVKNEYKGWSRRKMRCLKRKSARVNI